MIERNVKLTSRRRLGVQMVTAAVAATAIATSVEAAQPHMEAALHALNNAERELNSAEPDKGGHREKAMGLVRDAIAEVHEGIRVGAGR